MAAPTLSVALCTYNGERFVAEQVHSILAQTLPPRELVVSDDGSSDSTLAVVRATVKEWGGSIELLVIENPAPLGVIRNFEQAILACSSDLVALSDQDDVWMPDRLARIVPLFQERPALLLVHSDAQLIDAAGDPLGATLLDALEVTPEMKDDVRAGRAFEVLMRRNIVTGATTVIRRSLAERAAPFPPSWIHDEWLAVVAAATGEIDLLPEQLIGYRQHGGNQIGARRLTLREKFGRLVEPGGNRNRRLLARAGALADKLDDLGAADARRDAARANLAHELARSGYSVHRAARIAPVARELRTGRYTAYGRGITDAVRDLLQPTAD